MTQNILSEMKENTKYFFGIENLCFPYHMLAVVHLQAFSKVTVSIFGTNNRALEVKHMDLTMIFIFM